MAINFPNNPAVNDTFTVGGTTFTFTGVKWESSAVVELSSDTTPTLGGDLDGGAKNINNVGVITATGLDINGDADISGNLSVQGTTTTIDTAVTSVDSLQIDGTVAIGTATGETNFLTTINGDLSLGEKNGVDNTYIDQKQDGSLEIINSGRTANTGSVRINRHNNISGDTTYFRNLEVYDGKNNLLLLAEGSSGNIGIGTANSSAGAKLEVHSDTIPRINTVFQGSKHFGMSVGGSGCGFVLTDGHFMTVNHQPYADRGTDNNLTERLRITSGGTIFSYSPDDTTPNFKFRSNDTNWHGALNQSVHGGTITSFLSCGGDWDANGTTYSCTKNLAAYPSSAIAVHNQYNSSFESKFVFLTKAGGSTTTDGGVTELASISSAGVISDSKGDLRKIPFKQESSAYTLVLADSGKAIEVQGDVTVPNNVFNSGDTITIINDSSSNKTISKGTGLQYMFNTADGTNANRTLGGRGMATIYFVNSTTCYISGSQLT